MTQDHRVVIIGYGLAGSVFHAPLIASTPGLKLSGIVSKSDERIAQAQATYPGVEVFADTTALWDSELPDLVVIATPNVAHAPLALEAIARGVAVVVDKPIAISSAEAAQVVEASESASTILTVFQNRRWDGDFQTARKLIEDGSLGRVARFESRFERWRPKLKGGWRETVSPAEGGGLLFDLGAHIVDQAVAAFGPITHVYAEVDTTRERATTDDDVFVALTHTNGVRSHLFASATAADIGPRFRILGTKGAYVVHGLDPQEAALRDGQTPRPGWGEVAEPEWGTLTTDSGSEAIPTIAGAYPSFYAELVTALNGNGPVPVDPWDAVNTLRVIEAARISSVENRVVTLGE